MRLLSDSIGRKAVMAITGLLMVLFVVGHLLGNSTIFAGANALNSYAEHLHALVPVVWGTRVVMLVAVVLHLVISLKITAENQEANPTRYAVNRMLRATFASRTMIYTGLILGVFIVYHLLHFTFRVTPGLAIGNDPLDPSRFDVFTMVYEAFRNAVIAAVYVVAVVSLFLHLSHGVQSTFQSLGLNNEKSAPRFGVFGRALSTIFLLGYGAIPVLILVGVLAK
jgi:succinate dehydrogenase / fumarate reductase, cytochrome b subunit